ncbi:CCA tRNA nucleotidyltransferase [Alteromonas gilva]|uniref:CCA-adding enzyme n=1 Tax=Alteromonas gilva TaxID=2987522 RepID=A0ABT5L6H5_9ALTE|nr:CCA tRNA nucleotidyltransferase [Alteromonas gilva]MDC8832645.1 CCA tRNA nucleotidyltransferase [Alteromonas gilva]
MQVYLVGGAVRDSLLKRPVTDRDWVVVGATADQLIAQGYTQVGKDFPVFLHPKTQEEYALARTERKTGSGYGGFTCNASPHVTLEEDLQRRDLTINAMAQDSNGELIDPFNGAIDLADRVLRHVSDAFSEDPLRIFRVARFAARYAYLGFSVAPATMTLMQRMSATADILALSPERVWQETRRSLMERSPQIYFDILQQSGALSAWMPELSPLRQDSERAAMLQRAADSAQSLETRWASLLFALPQQDIQALQTRLKVPNQAADNAQLAAQFIGDVAQYCTDSEWLLNLFNVCDAWRRPERLERLLTLLPIVYAEDASRYLSVIKAALAAAQAVDVQQIISAGFKGPGIKEQLTQQRLEQISQVST